MIYAFLLALAADLLVCILVLLWYRQSSEREARAYAQWLASRRSPVTGLGDRTPTRTPAATTRPVTAPVSARSGASDTTSTSAAPMDYSNPAHPAWMGHNSAAAALACHDSGPRHSGHDSGSSYSSSPDSGSSSSDSGSSNCGGDQ